MEEQDLRSQAAESVERYVIDALSGDRKYTEVITVTDAKGNVTSIKTIVKDILVPAPLLLEIWRNGQGEEYEPLTLEIETIDREEEE